MSATAKGLILDRVAISLKGRDLFQPLSLAVAPGEVVTVMGPSGSGKSSLLSYLCGTLDWAFAGRGEAAIDGTSLIVLPPERRRLGILFQDDLLFPHLSVADNLAFGLTPGLAKAERRAKLEEALVSAGLAGFGERDPATLSGGQRARVALLRTLLAVPRALLLDEPFNKLDRPLRSRFRAFVFEHAAERALPTLLVTHDPEDVPQGGRILTLEDRSD